MEEQARQSAFMSALVTEHFVLQSAIGTAVNEAASRASLYIFSLSSALVAMGFASESQSALVPFAATVLPAIFLLGVFTVLRLVDTAVENLHFLAGIARIRGYYRTLAPEAEAYFAAESGRWPEPTMLSKRRGSLVLFFTPASMVAFINSLVAGAGVTLLVVQIFGRDDTLTAIALGVVTALVLSAAFLSFQHWRYRIFEPATPDVLHG
jgi:hypothetical protein